MNPKGHLDEYLLNDVGKVYKGSYKTPVGKDWAFGQFDGKIITEKLRHLFTKMFSKQIEIKIAIVNLFEIVIY